MGATEVFNTTGAKIRRRTTRQDFRTGLRSRSSEADIREYVRVKCMANEKSTLSTTMSALLRIDKPNFDKDTLDKMIIDAITSNNNLVNEVGPDQATPLHSAILHERKAIVDSLVANGANIQAQDAKLRLPLHYAAKTKGKEFIEALQLKDDSSMACARDCYGRTAFAIACKSGSDEVALYLLHRFPNAALCADNRKRTPFHIAVSCGRLGLVKAIWEKLAQRQDSFGNHNSAKDRTRHTTFTLDGRFSIDQQNQEGYTALHLASAKGHLEVVNFLLARGADPAVLSKDDEICLWQAVRHNHKSIALRLLKEPSICEYLDQCSTRNLTLLSLSCKPGHFWARQPLLASGASCLVDNGDGSTPITKAIELSNDDALCDFLSSHQMSSDINLAISCYDADGKQTTALHVACQCGTLFAVQELLRSGSNPDRTDAAGRTSLHVAVIQGNYDIVDALLLAECHDNIRDKQGWSPVHHACFESRGSRHMDPITALSETAPGSLDEESFASQKGYVGIIQLLRNTALTAQTMEGDSTLHIAARKGHESRVDCLLEMSSEAPDATGFEEILNSSGETALDCALRESHFAIAEKLAVKMVDIRFIDETSRNDVLEKLVKAKQHTLIAMLLYKEAESQNIPGVHAVSSHATALELATYRGLTNLVRLLLENMALSSIRDPSIQAARRVCERELERRGPADDRGNESDDSSPPETQSYENFEQILDLLQWPPTLTSSTPYSLRLDDRDPEQLPDIASNYRVMLVDIDDKALRQYSLPLTEFMENKASWRVMEVYKRRTEARDKPRQLKPSTDVNVKWVHLPANSVSTPAVYHKRLS